MARNKLNHPHGDAGEKPPDTLNFQAGGKPNPEHFDWFWATVTSVVDGHATEFGRLDSDNDGQVDAADTADDAANVTSTYKGNDIDVDGDGKVNSAEAADTAVKVKDNDIDSNGDGQVDAADTADNATNVTSTYKGNDIDSDGDGRVNAADNTIRLKGNDIDSDGDGRVNAADDATTLKGNEIDADGDGKVDAAETADEADQVDGFDAAQLLGGSTDNVSSIDLDAGQFTALQRFDGDDLPSGTELVVREANVTNGEHNTPNGLSVIIHDVSANTTLTTYNGLSFGITETFTVGNSDLLLAVDNGSFTTGTGTAQTNVTGHITYDLR